MAIFGHIRKYDACEDDQTMAVSERFCDHLLRRPDMAKVRIHLFWRPEMAQERTVKLRSLHEPF